MLRTIFAQNNTAAKTLAQLLAAIFCLWVTPNEGRAQPLRQRLFVSLEASVNTSEYGGAASFSLAAEPKLWIANKFYAGLKCDVPMGSFGDNDGNYYDKPVLGAVSSILLKGYFEQRFGYAKLYMGYGMGRLFSNETYSGRQNPGSPSVLLDTMRLSPVWATEFSIGAKGDNIYLGFSFKKPRGGDDYSDVQPYMSTSLGLEFGNGKNLTTYKTVNEYRLPPFMLELGHQLAVPVGRSPGAVSRAVYAEFKVGIKHRFSIGARLVDFPREAYGTDREGYPKELQQQVPSSPFLDFGRINTMQLVKSNTLFVDYYLPRKNGWVYMGIGGGWYRFEGLETIVFSPIFVLPGIPSASRAGMVLRLGHKVGFFRSGLNLNLIGSGVPSYASFHLGIEPGFFIYRDKSGD